MEPHTFENLGAHERTPDPRDHLIGSATAYTYPATKMQQAAFDAPIYYQGKRPACGAHAGAWAKMFLDILDGKPVTKRTPRYIWANLKRDGTDVSAGTSMDRIFSTLQQYGADAFEPLENDITFDDKSYAALRNISPAMLADGQNNKIGSYAYPQDLTFNGIKQTISDFGYCILLLKVSARFWSDENGVASWAEKDILPLGWPSAKFPVVDGHFVVAHSYDEHYIYFANSFGDTWGRKGHGYFGPGYMPWVIEKGIMHNPPAPVVDVVQTALPQVQAAIIQLPTMTPAQQVLGQSLIDKLLAALLQMLRG